MNILPHNSEAARPVRRRANLFLLGSLLVHAIAVYALSQEAFESGLARKPGTAEVSRLLEARIIFSEEGQPALVQQARIDLASSARADQKSSQDSSMAPIGVAQSVHVTATEEYVPSGRLTSLPTPLTEIDLNISTINSLDFVGKMELTLLIGADGAVDEVITVGAAEEMGSFPDQVAARFKNALFKAGEIDGRSVRSRLQVTIISELAR